MGGATLFLLLVVIPVTLSVTRGWAYVRAAASHASESIKAGVVPGMTHFTGGTEPFDRCHVCGWTLALLFWLLGCLVG